MITDKHLKIYNLYKQNPALVERSAKADQALAMIKEYEDHIRSEAETLQNQSIYHAQPQPQPQPVIQSQFPNQPQPTLTPRDPSSRGATRRGNLDIPKPPQPQPQQPITDPRSPITDFHTTPFQPLAEGDPAKRSEARAITDFHTAPPSSTAVQTEHAPSQPPQPPQPQPEPQLTPYDPTLIQRAKDKIASFFAPSHAEQTAKAQNIMAISEETGIRPADIEKNYEEITNIVGKETGLKQQPTAKESFSLAMTAPITAGILSNPVGTAMGLATFGALSEIENGLVSLAKKDIDYKFGAGKELKDLVPNTGQSTQKALEILDFVGKGLIARGIYKKAPKVADKFTKDIIKQYNLPKTIRITPAEARSAQLDATKISKEKLDMLKDLNLSSKQWKAAVKQGKVIEIPAETLIRKVDKPWFAKFKKIFKMEPTDITIATGDRTKPITKTPESHRLNTQNPTYPSTQHPAPSTQHPAPSTQHPAPRNQHPETSTQHPAPSPQLTSIEQKLIDNAINKGKHIPEQLLRERPGLLEAYQAAPETKLDGIIEKPPGEAPPKPAVQTEHAPSQHAPSQPLAEGDPATRPAKSEGRSGKPSSEAQATDNRSQITDDRLQTPTTTKGVTYVRETAQEGMPALQATLGVGVRQKLPSGGYQQDYDQIEGYRIGLRKIFNTKSDKADYDEAVQRYNEATGENLESFDQLKEKLEAELYEYSEGLRDIRTGEPLDISPEERQIIDMVNSMDDTEANKFLEDMERDHWRDEEALSGYVNELTKEKPLPTIQDIENAPIVEDTEIQQLRTQSLKKYYESLSKEDKLQYDEINRTLDPAGTTEIPAGSRPQRPDKRSESTRGPGTKKTDALDQAGPKIRAASEKIDAKTKELKALKTRADKLNKRISALSQRGILGTNESDQAAIFGDQRPGLRKHLAKTDRNIKALEAEIDQLKTQKQNLQEVQKGETTADLFPIQTEPAPSQPTPPGEQADTPDVPKTTTASDPSYKKLFKQQDNEIEHKIPIRDGNADYFEEASGDIFRELTKFEDIPGDHSYIKSKLKKLSNIKELTQGDINQSIKERQNLSDDDFNKHIASINKLIKETNNLPDSNRKKAAIKAMELNKAITEWIRDIERDPKAVKMQNKVEELESAVDLVFKPTPDAPKPPVQTEPAPSRPAPSPAPSHQHPAPSTQHPETSTQHPAPSPQKPAPSTNAYQPSPKATLRSEAKQGPQPKPQPSQQKAGPTPLAETFIQLPELIELIGNITAGKLPKIAEKLGKDGRLGQARGDAMQILSEIAIGHKLKEYTLDAKPNRADEIEQFLTEYPEYEGQPLHADIRRKKGQYIVKIFRKDPTLAPKVIAHELGHVIDYLPHETIRKGNLLGRIRSLKESYRKHTMSMDPESGDHLTAKDRARIRRAIKKLLEKDTEEIEIEIKKEIPLTAKEILGIWRDTEAAIKNRSLNDYIAGLSDKQKLDIVRAALKGNVPDWVKFKNIVVEKGTKHVSPARVDPKKFRERYQQAIIDEMRKRRLVSLEEITNELKNVTQKWSPFDEAASPKYTAYRNSSVELYADAISVLLNDPATLQKEAPLFWQTFHNYLVNKPNVKRNYEKILEKIRMSPKERFLIRAGKVLESFTATEKKSGEKKDSLEVSEFDKTLTKILSKSTVLRKMTANALQKPFQKVSEYQHVGSNHFMLARDVGQKVLQKLDKFPHKTLKEFAKNINYKGNPRDLPEHIFGLYAMLSRNITERDIYFNPWGYDAESSRQDLEQMKAIFGKSFDILENAKNTLFDIRGEHVFPILEMCETESPESMALITDNDNYFAYDVVKFEEDLHRKAGTFHTTMIYKQKGTFDEIANPFVRTLLHDMYRMSAALRSRAARSIVDTFLNNEELEQYIEPASRGRDGKVNVVDNKQVKTLVYRHKGEVKAYYLPAEIANSLETNFIELGKVLNLVANTTKILKEVWIGKNPAWAIGNLFRDSAETIKHNREITITNYIINMLASTPEVLSDVFLSKTSPNMRKMYKKRILPAYRQRMEGRDPNKTQLYHAVKTLESSSRSKYLRLNLLATVGAVLDGFSTASEKLPVLAGYKTLKKYNEKQKQLKKEGKKHDRILSEEEIRYKTIKNVGSPDFLDKGKWSQFIDFAVPFTHASMKGFGRSVGNMKSDPANYAKRTLLFNIAPSAWSAMTKYGIIAGLLAAILKKAGEDPEENQVYQHFKQEQKRLEKIPTYEMTNNYIIPFGETVSDKTLYFRMPHDFTGNIFNGLTHLSIKSIAEKGIDPEEYTKFLHNELPVGGFNATLSLGMDIMDLATGTPIYDDFRGGLAIPDKYWESTQEERIMAFLRYEWNKNLGHSLFKLEDNKINKFKTDLEKKLATPILGPAARRFIRVTDAGIKERFYRKMLIAKKARNIKNLEVDRKVAENIRSGVDPSEIDKSVVDTYKKLYNDPKIVSHLENIKKFNRSYQKKIKLAELKKYNNGYADMLRIAGSFENYVTIDVIGRDINLEKEFGDFLEYKQYELLKYGMRDITQLASDDRYERNKLIESVEKKIRNNPKKYEKYR